MQSALLRLWDTDGSAVVQMGRANFLEMWLIVNCQCYSMTPPWLEENRRFSIHLGNSAFCWSHSSRSRQRSSVVWLRCGSEDGQVGNEVSEMMGVRKVKKQVTDSNVFLIIPGSFRSAVQRRVHFRSRQSDSQLCYLLEPSLCRVCWVFMSSLGSVWD